LVQRDGFQIIVTDKAGISSFPTSQGAVVGRMVFTSGHGPLSPGGSSVKAKTLQEQVKQTIENIECVLKEAGSGLEHIVRMQVFLRRFEDFAEFNKVYAELMPRPLPPRACVIADLVREDIDVEMIADAVIPEKAE